MQIKGIFLKDYVQIVKDSPDLDWNRHLTASDWEIVKSLIVPSQWYPADTMAHIGRGIFEMRTKGNYAAVRLHGRARATDSFDPATQKFLLKRDPVAALSAYAMIVRRYIDEIEVRLEKSGPGLAEVAFFPVEGVPAWDLFREIQAGTLEKLVELNAGQDPKAEFRSETRQGREACVMVVTWKQEPNPTPAPNGKLGGASR